MKSILRSTLAALAVAFACTSLSAQAVPTLTSGFSSDKRDPNVPTDISAMSMDINMRKNLITLMGDVFLDDQQATIQCNKMIIHLEEKAPDKDAKQPAKDAKKDAKEGAKDAKDTKEVAKEKPLTTPPDENGNAQIAGDKTATLVECFEDVVIIPKNKKPTADGKKPEEIKATANKAIYDLVKNEVTLLENPVIINGANKIVGTKIIFLVNEDRVIITRGKATTKEGLDTLRQNKGE